MVRWLLAIGFAACGPTAVAAVHCEASWVGEGDADRPAPIGGVEVFDRIKLGDTLLVRRNLADPSAEAREDVKAFAEAVRLLKSADGDPDKLPGRSVKLGAYEALRAVHGHVSAGALEPRAAGSELPQPWGQCVHGIVGRNTDGPLFLLWHRAFVRAFEISANSILASNSHANFKGFGVPYWDWLEYRAFPAALRCPESPGQTACSTPSTRVQEANDRFHRNPLFSMGRIPKTRTDQPLWTPVLGINPISTAHSDFTKLNLELESTWHDVIHFAVGGWMRNPGFAVIDPVFWVHHAQVDRLLEGWGTAVIAQESEAANDLLEQAGPRSELAQAWRKKRAMFPVWCGRKLVWYQPRYEDLVPMDRGGKARLGYRYDSTELPQSAGRYQDVDVSAVVEALTREGVPVTDLLRTPRDGTTLKPSAEERLQVPGSGARFRIRPQDLGLDDVLRRRLSGYTSSPLSRKQAERLRRRAVMLRFDEARLDRKLDGYFPYTVIGRIGSNVEPAYAAPWERNPLSGFHRISGETDAASDGGWRYLSSVGSFGLPIGSRPHAHHGHSEAADPLIDLTDAIVWWLGHEAVPNLRPPPILELAIIPTTVAEDGALRPVNPEATPGDDLTPGLSFKSMTILLRQEAGR